METAVTLHYASLLAGHYTWMFGMPFDAKVAEQRSLLEHLGLAAGSRGTAVDLGCGPGFQSFALAQLGFARILAVDSSPALLAELEARKAHQPIETICAGMLDVARLIRPGGAEVVLCMGDTLTHLASHADVPRLFAAVHRVLAPGGRFVLTFRDLSGGVTGLDRFFPVHGDAQRVMTCFLEYEPETVVVHDLIHVREGGGWKLLKGCYRKLRLAPDRIAADMMAAGFTVLRNEPAGRLWAIAGGR
jgi:SAM-dependent methyltransferase